MAESITVDARQPEGLEGKLYVPGVTKVKIDWQADAAGNVNLTSTEKIAGTLLRVVTVPDPDDPPDDNYNIQILCDEGIDLLNGAGANRDTANTEQVCPFISLIAPVLISSTTLTVVITNAGANNKGTIFMYLVFNR